MKKIKFIITGTVTLLALNLSSNAQSSISPQDQAQIRAIVGPDYAIDFIGKDAIIRPKQVKFKDVGISGIRKNLGDNGLIITQNCQSNCNGNGNGSGNGNGNGSGNGNSNGNGSGNGNSNNSNKNNGNFDLWSQKLGIEKMSRLELIAQKYNKDFVVNKAFMKGVKVVRPVNINRQ